MERHRCKLCLRNFSNGRALGGHMRSHVINKQVLHDQDEDEDQIHSCSSSQGEVEINREFSVVLQHCESETESSRSNIFGRRLKRARKSSRIFSSKKLSNSGETTNEDRSPLSSVSDTTAEEDVAHCLMMLSRDKWEKENEKDDDEDCGDVVKVMKKDNKVRGKYKCETCNKLFKSYQALGGHRASYKKIKADVAARLPRDGGSTPAAEVAAAEKVHECPFCHRVFASGQALGGHKRSHFMGASNFTTVKKVSRIGENWDIDLNLPAPVDDGGEINLSEQ